MWRSSVVSRTGTNGFHHCLQTGQLYNDIERFHLLPHSRLDLQHRDLSFSNLPDCSHIWA
jgi:hypothetical protein